MSDELITAEQASTLIGKAFENLEIEVDINNIISQLPSGSIEEKYPQSIEEIFPRTQDKTIRLYNLVRFSTIWNEWSKGQVNINSGDGESSTRSHLLVLPADTAIDDAGYFCILYSSNYTWWDENAHTVGGDFKVFSHSTTGAINIYFPTQVGLYHQGLAPGIQYGDHNKVLTVNEDNCAEWKTIEIPDIDTSSLATKEELNNLDKKITNCCSEENIFINGYDDIHKLVCTNMYGQEVYVWDTDWMYGTGVKEYLNFEENEAPEPDIKQYFKFTNTGEGYGGAAAALLQQNIEYIKKQDYGDLKVYTLIPDDYYTVSFYYRGIFPHQETKGYSIQVQFNGWDYKKTIMIPEDKIDEWTHVEMTFKHKSASFSGIALALYGLDATYEICGLKLVKTKVATNDVAGLLIPLSNNENQFFAGDGSWKSIEIPKIDTSNLVSKIELPSLINRVTIEDVNAMYVHKYIPEGNKFIDDNSLNYLVNKLNFDYVKKEDKILYIHLYDDGDGKGMHFTHQSGFEDEHNVTHTLIATWKKYEDAAIKGSSNDFVDDGGMFSLWTGGIVRITADGLIDPIATSLQNWFVISELRDISGLANFDMRNVTYMYNLFVDNISYPEKQECFIKSFEPIEYWDLSSIKTLTGGWFCDSCADIANVDFMNEIRPSWSPEFKPWR